MPRLNARCFAIISCISLGALAVVACDPSLDEPEFRGGGAATPKVSIGAVLLHEPVPGGGGCEGCVSCFDRAAGSGMATMCVRPDTKYTGSTIQADDDRAPLELNSSELKWQMYIDDRLTQSEGQTSFDDPTIPVCNQDHCVAVNLGTQPAGHALLKLFNLSTTFNWAPSRLRFTELGDDAWFEQEGPVVEIPAEIGPTPQAEPDLGGLAADVVAPDAVSRAIAHITYPSSHGGIASCSGVLISNRHVLTAAHCLTPDPDALGDALQSSTNELDVPAGLKVRLGGLGSPDHESFKHDIQHGARAIHVFPDGDVDLAMIELNLVYIMSKAPPPLQLGEPFDAAQDTAPAAPLVAYGYGVSGVLAGLGYDWGRLKRTVLQASGDTSVLAGFVNPQDLMSFAPTPGEIGVCRGDSGGPVLRNSKVVGIMILRVLAGAPDGPNDSITEADLELVAARGFPWSRYNACGRGPARAYVAVRLDQPRIHDWLMCIIQSKSGAQCGQGATS